MTPPEVWITYYVDYPDLAGDDGWWASEQDAVDGLKRRYSHPYVVAWREYRDEDGLLHLEGQFQQVRGYSTKHVALWTIRREEIAA